MSRSQPRSIFGVHSVTPYARDTLLPYGELRVVQSSTLSLSGELLEQLGGSSKYPWAAEEGAITAEMTLSVGELPDFMFTLFLGQVPTANSAEATGNVSTLANAKGSSIQGTTNAVTSVSAITGSESNLKFGRYIMKAVSTNTFDLYLTTSLDIGRGTDGTVLTDDMKVASAISFSSSAALVAAHGLQFNQNGTLAFTTNDTASFEVRPINQGNSVVRIGGMTEVTFPEFGAYVSAQKRGNGQMTHFNIFRCKAAGMPIPFERAQFAKFEVKIKCLYDSVQDAVFEMVNINGNS